MYVRMYVPRRGILTRISLRRVEVICLADTEERRLLNTSIDMWLCTFCHVMSCHVMSLSDSCCGIVCTIWLWWYSGTVVQCPSFRFIASRRVLSEHKQVCIPKNSLERTLHGRGVRGQPSLHDKSVGTTQNWLSMHYKCWRCLVGTYVWYTLTVWPNHSAQTATYIAESKLTHVRKYIICIIRVRSQHM